MDLKNTFSQILPNAIEVCMRSTFTEMNDQSEKIADIIDQYVKSMCIYGTVITAGSPVTQTALINPGGVVNIANPVAGKIPNILGVM